jgi:hypothetical protein
MNESTKVKQKCMPETPNEVKPTRGRAPAGKRACRIRLRSHPSAKIINAHRDTMKIIILALGPLLELILNHYSVVYSGGEFQMRLPAGAPPQVTCIYFLFYQGIHFCTT